MKKNLLLLIVLVMVIGALVGVPKLLAARKAPELFKGFDKAKVERVHLKKFANEETLSKKDGKWFATQNGEYPADTAKVNALLEAVAKQKKKEPQSKNPAKHKDLGVDSASATKVTVEGGRKFTFLVGNMAQGWTGNFMRFDGSNEVFVTEGSFDQAFSSSPNFFRDKSLLRFNKDNVGEFSVFFREDSGKEPPVEIEGRFDAASGKWKLTKPEAVDGDPARVSEYLAKFAALEADDWYEKEADAAPGFDNPALKASFKLTDGTAITLLIGAERNGNRYARIENSANKYLIRKYRLDGLKKKDWQTLIAIPAPPAEMGAPGAPDVGAMPPAP